MIHRRVRATVAGLLAVATAGAATSAGEWLPNFAEATDWNEWPPSGMTTRTG
jgi:hypothetical protein